MLSIQLRLDGVSFSVDSYRNIDQSRPIHLLSHRTMLSPASQVESLGAEAVIREGGITLSSNDKIISIPREQNVALIVLSNDRYNQILDTFGEDAPFTSPILRTALNGDSHLIIYCAQGLTYINMYSSECMLLSEVFLSPTLNDTLYWLSRIGEAIPLDDYTIYVANSDRKTADFLIKYYPNIELCE